MNACENQSLTLRTKHRLKLYCCKTWDIHSG